MKAGRRVAVKVQFFRLKDDNVRAATGFVVASTKVDLAFRRSRAAAFVGLKSVSLRSAVRAATSLVRLAT